MSSSSSSSSPPPSPAPAPLPAPPSPSSSSLIGCPELDLSVTLGSTCPKTSGSHLKPRPLTTTTSHHGGQSQPKPRPQTQTGRGGARRDRTAARKGAESPAAVSNHEPGFLERAELNTTLALKAELQSLQGAEFNSQKAVQETLRRSERTKNLINTRATEEVNVSRSRLLFSSLVGVSVQEDQLIQRALQHRLPPPPVCHGASERPSLRPFMTSEHLRQKPLPLDPEGEEPVCYKPRPLPCPASSCFDLHRRGRCWET